MNTQVQFNTTATQLIEIKNDQPVTTSQNITTRTTKVTGKGQIYFVNRYLNRLNGGDPDASSDE